MKRSRGLLNIAAACLAGLCAIGTAQASDGAASAFVELLFGSNVKLPARTVLLTVYKEGWRAEYRFAGGDNGSHEIAICIENGPIFLAVNKEVALRVTSDDVIHTLSIPELGMTIDAIPGRLNEKAVKPAKAGKFAAQVEIKKDGRTIQKAIEIKVLHTMGYRQWHRHRRWTNPCS